MVLDLIFVIIVILIIGAVFYLIARLIVNAYLENGIKKRAADRQAAHEQALLPLKLQAGERMVLLLERMTPPQSVYRTLQPGMTVIDLQMTLIRTIREEYEHNVAQQIYFSPACWALIKTAKEEVIRLVNISASESDPGAAAGEMARKLLERWGEPGQNHLQAAIDQIKAETGALL